MISLNKRKMKKLDKVMIHDYLPIIATLVMSLTVPALALINAMYPIVIVGLCLGETEK